MWKTCSSFFNDRGRSDCDLLKLRLLRKDMNAQPSNRKDRLSIFERLERGETRHRVLRLTFERGRFVHFRFGTVDFFLAIFNLRERAGARFLQRTEEKTEIDVEQNDKPHRAESELLRLVFA